MEKTTEKMETASKLTERVLSHGSGIEAIITTAWDAVEVQGEGGGREEAELSTTVALRKPLRRWRQLARSMSEHWHTVTSSR